MSTEVCGPFVVALLNSTPMFEWSVVRLVMRDRDQKDICYDATGLCAQHV